MEIKSLNCASCGAPIKVPEDVDYLNCSSCGSYLAVQRGEGYIALKIVKEVTDAIKRTGAETQSAIRDGTYATKTELQKLQLTQEISMVEMQLNSLQGEVRGLERAIQPGVANPRLTSQIQDLYFQVYRTADRLRNLRRNLARVNSAASWNDPAVLEDQLQFIRFCITSLERADKKKTEVNKALAAQRKLADECSNSLLQIKLRALRSSLASVNLTLESATDPEQTFNCCNLIKKDIQYLEQPPQTPEKIIFLNNLRKQYDAFANQWRQLETQRVQASAQSLNLPHPKGLTTDSLQAGLTQIQSDLHILSTWQDNEIVQYHLKNLREKEKRYQKALAKAEGKTLTLLGAGGLFAGLALLLQNAWKGATKKPVRADGAAPQAASEESAVLDTSAETAEPVEAAGTETPQLAMPTEITAPEILAEPSKIEDDEEEESQDIEQQVFSRRRLWGGIGLGVLILLLVSFVGFIVAGILTMAAEETTWQIGFFLLTVFAGFAGGTGVFFKTTQSLPVKPVVKLVGIALAVLIGGALLSLAIAFFIPGKAGTSVLMAAMCLVPLATIIVSVVGARKMKSASKTVV